jgi:hypothetical protein
MPSPNVIKVFITPQKESPIIRRKYSFTADLDNNEIIRTPLEGTAEKLGLGDYTCDQTPENRIRRELFPSSLTA